MKEQFPDGFTSTSENRVLEELDNNYLKARTIELSVLLDFLLRNHWVNPINLQGPVIDLGTGSGVGLLALRKFTTGYIIGVDRATRQHYHSYAGQYEVPTPAILNLAVASFRREDMRDFLKHYPLESVTLVTAFYVSMKGWHDNSCPAARFFGCNCNKVSTIIEEIGKILKPGGQFLATSDGYDIPKPNWATNTVSLVGSEEKDRYRPLILPLPIWVRNRYHTWFKAIEHSIEPELTETNGEYIGILRDRNVKVFTKMVA